MSDDLPELVARLREARPDLIARTPWWCEGKAHFGHPWYCIDDDAARAIVIGVCAEVIADAGVQLFPRPTLEVRWLAAGGVHPDFLTALVEAVIALAEEDRHAQ